ALEKAGIPYAMAGGNAVAAMAARGLASSTRIANNSTAVTVPSTSGLFAGMTVTGTGIPANTTVVSINSVTGLTLSNAATATAVAVSLTFTPITGTAVTFPGTVQIGFFQSGSGYVALDALQLFPSIPAPVNGTIGDRNPIREQGQFLITNNVVRNSSQYGISIDAGVRDATGIPHPGVPQNLRYLNTGRLAPGAVITNNIVAESGTAAIRFSGDSTATPASAVPYGRIVNNTIFGGATFQTGLGTTKSSQTASVSASFIPYLLTGMTVSGTGISAGTTIAAINAAAGTITLSSAATATGSATATFTSPNVGAVGVAVSDNAAPTLLNNVFAQFSGASGVGVSVDGTSRTDSSGNLRTVLGANAYYQVTTQVSAGVTQNDAVTVTADPFVRSYAANFYPARAVAGSPSIIDSSLNTLQDRNEFVNLISPLGMPPSPIIAPALDIYGQLRADDPNVASSPGLGANPFKDRGAVDRIDTTQPSVMLTTPLDESTSDLTTGLTGLNRVRLERGDAANITKFVLQFSDTGIGIDKQSLSAGAVSVYYSATAGVSNWSGVPEFNATASNYLFRWLTNSNQVVLESASVFAPGEYLITVDNTQVSDLAGNLLLNNDVNGIGTTAFKIVLVDIPSKPTTVLGLPYATSTGAPQDGTRVSLSWTAPASNGGTPVTSYSVQQQESTNGGTTWSAWSTSTVTTGPATATTAEVTGLVPGRLYQFRITANNGVQPDVTLGPNWSDFLGPIAPLRTPTLALQTDSNITTDLYTKFNTVNVTGLETGA
ncbi:MAG: fibronectin type III domain-containing protein, partial [Planctomycetia bacterium]|nr:fibronectin type III domain-containing protein [Planctomycetia bacterium]